MSSEEFRVSMSGPTTSFFLFEAVNNPTDFEGLLFGDYQRCLHREISDQDDADDQNRPATIIHDVYIRRIIPTGVKFSFYDRRFNANIPEYAADVVKHMNSSPNEPISKSSQSSISGRTSTASSSRSQQQQQSIDPNEPTVRSGFLGWFRFQKCPPLRVLSELSICRALSTPEALRYFPVINDNVKIKSGDQQVDLSLYYPWPGNGPFYLFSYPSAKNNILEWGIQLKAYNSSTSQLRTVRMNIRNLGDTTHTDYWKLGDGGSAAASGVDRLLPGVVSEDFSKHLVDETERMAEKAKDQLMKMTDQVLHENQKSFQTWQNLQKKSSSSSTQPSLQYIKYGYSPSSNQELQALLDNLRSMIGSKSVGANASLGGGDHMLVDLEMGSTGNFSKTSDDLLASVGPSTGTPLTPVESGNIDIVDDDWQHIEEEISEVTLEDDDGDFQNVQHPKAAEFVNNNPRGSKRPKPNTSSSSSGATSDELPESTTTPNNAKPSISSTPIIVSTVSLAPKSQSTSSGGGVGVGGQRIQKLQQQQPLQQQRKKSKSSDSGSSAECQDTNSPSAQQIASASSSRGGSIRDNTPTPTSQISITNSNRGSPVSHSGSASSNTGYHPPIGKGRGQRQDAMLKQVTPPPGFAFLPKKP